MSVSIRLDRLVIGIKHFLRENSPSLIEERPWRACDKPFFVIASSDGYLRNVSLLALKLHHFVRR